jgi:glycosyltransferase involved in cell wall biosynthesis
VAILTGGGDRPYALGLALSLIQEGIRLDFIGSDFLEAPELRESPLVKVLNLRGDVGPHASPIRKVVRVLAYYVRLLRYTVGAKPRIFHILWNNKFEVVDRTLLLIYYRIFGKRLVLTVHNVNIRKRDGNDGLLNRLTLRAQYGLVHHLFVHTQLMKRELQSDFGVRDAKISVIPFGINNTVPSTGLTRKQARKQLGLDDFQPALLFFGNIAPYKGLEYLVDAMKEVAETLPHARLIIAGRPKGAEGYWARIEQRIASSGLDSVVIQRIEYVPDEDIEIYFKAADVLVLPYIHVFQSGVLFLGYNFGLPVIASDVGPLREEIIDEQTGFVCEPRDTRALAAAIKRYFSSELYRTLESRRSAIRTFAADQYSWSKVASITVGVYRSQLATMRLFRRGRA